jgi:(E)-4-hydroxy-3-methylbut-2-enyl-diphosphate synthase
MEIKAVNLTDQPVAPHPTYKVGVRRMTRQVMLGTIKVGGGAPISVQTMTKTKTSDIDATVRQIVDAAEAGCDIVRVTVNDKEAADAMAAIVSRSPIPVVADIHFNHVFALKAIDAGVAKVRINPGNIGSRERIHQVLSAAKARGIPIRIGVNSGSLEEDILAKHGYPTAEALYESAMRHVGICDEFGFRDVIISVKSTDVRLMIEAYRLVAQRTDIPLHLGVTEAGPTKVGTIKSAVGIGTLLAEGIGDTIRVSLTDEPVKEVEVGKEILRALSLATRNVELIACPTCGRLEVDLFGIMGELEKRLEGV